MKGVLFLFVGIFLIMFLVEGVSGEIFIDCDFSSAPSSENNGGVYTCDTGTLTLSLRNLNGIVFEHISTGGWENSAAAKFYSHTSLDDSDRMLVPSASSTTRQNIRWLMKFTDVRELGGKWSDHNQEDPRTWLSFSSRNEENCGIGEYRPEPAYSGTAYVVHCGGVESSPCGSYQWCCDNSYGEGWWDVELSTCTEGADSHGQVDLADYENEWVSIEFEKQNNGTYKIYIDTQDSAYSGLYMAITTSIFQNPLYTNRVVGPYLELTGGGSGNWIIDEVVYSDNYIGPPAGFGSSTPECSNSLDDDGDGAIDFSGGDTGCTDANDDDESNCGDLVCEGGETCLTCPGDCVINVGEVCCSGVIYTGDCCLDADCVSLDTCVNYICTTPSGTIVSVDSTYGGYSMDVIDDEVIDAYNGTLTTWASGVSTTQPHWVVINFAQSRDINNIGIYWAYNNQQGMFMSSQEVQVQYWDGSQYLTAATISNTGAVEVSSAIFPTVSTTSLRFWQPINMGPPTYSNIFWLTEIDYSFVGSSCSPADTDSSGDINIGEIINYITRYKNGEINIGEVIAGITEYRYGC